MSIFDALQNILLFIATVYLPSQCSNYTLDTDATRLTSYSVVVGGGCDVSLYATPIWVRYGGTATRLATSAPAIYRCRDGTGTGDRPVRPGPVRYRSGFPTGRSIGRPVVTGRPAGNR